MHALSLRVRAVLASDFGIHRPLLWGFALLCSAAISPQAHANGRPPGTTGLVVAPHGSGPSQDTTLMLGVTFGLAVSHDAGKHFAWVCEEAIGGPTGVDALLAAPSDRVLLTGSTRGLYVSQDGGCNWQATPQFAPPNQVAALSAHPTDAKTWWVALNRPDAGKGELYVTHNSGRTYTKLPFSHPGVYLYGLAVAASHPDHIVVAGSNNGAHDSCLVYRSQNGGKTWTGGAVPGAPPASATPTVAIHPKNKNLIVLGALDITTNGSSVLLSEDGGKQFKVATHVAEPIRNITFATHSNQIFVAGTSHVYTSQDGGHVFSQLAKPSTNACLTVDGSAIYACGSSADGRDGFALAKSLDAGTTWSPLLSLGDIGPATSCPKDSTVQKVCAALWTNQAAMIQASKSADPAAEFIASEQAPTTAGAEPTPLAKAAQPADTGCHCASVGANATAPWAIMCALLAAQAVRRLWGRPKTARGHRQ